MFTHMTALDPPHVAYPVPWRIDRSDRAHPTLTNMGDAALDFVRVFHSDRYDERTQLWGRVDCGEQLSVCLCDADLDDVVISIAWFRPADGLEYLWRFVV